MSTKTDWFENQVINHFLRNSSVTPAATMYMALYTVKPSESSQGTELTGSGYARQAVTFSAPSAGGPGATFNSGSITFKASGGAWSAIAGYAIVDTSTGSTNQYYFTSVAGATLADGDSLVFAVGDIDVTED